MLETRPQNPQQVLTEPETTKEGVWLVQCGCGHVDSLVKTGNTTPLHDGLVTEIDMDAEEYADSIIAAVNMLFNLFLLWELLK